MGENKKILSDMDQQMLNWFYREMREMTNKDVNIRVLGDYISQHLLCYYVDHKLTVENDQDFKRYMCIYTSRELIDEKYPYTEEVQIGPIKDILKAAIELGSDGVCVNEEITINIEGCRRLLLESVRCEQIRRYAEEKKFLDETGIVLEFCEAELYKLPKTDVYTRMIIDNISTALDPDKVAWFLITERALSYYDLVHVQRIIENLEGLHDKKKILEEIYRQKSCLI